MAAQNELLAEAIFEDILVKLLEQQVVGTALTRQVCLLKLPQPAIHFAPPSWMFTSVYYAAVTTIRKNFGTRDRNYQTC